MSMLAVFRWSGLYSEQHWYYSGCSGSTNDSTVIDSVQSSKSQFMCSTYRVGTEMGKGEVGQSDQVNNKHVVYICSYINVSILIYYSSLSVVYVCPWCLLFGTRLKNFPNITWFPTSYVC